MTCDLCGVNLTPGNDGGHAPGLPLYVCKQCYKKLKKEQEEKPVEKKDGDN